MMKKANNETDAIVMFFLLIISTFFSLIVFTFTNDYFYAFVGCMTALAVVGMMMWIISMRQAKLYREQ